MPYTPTPPGSGQSAMPGLSTMVDALRKVTCAMAGARGSEIPRGQKESACPRTSRDNHAFSLDAAFSRAYYCRVTRLNGQDTLRHQHSHARICCGQPECLHAFGRHHGARLLLE